MIKLIPMVKKEHRCKIRAWLENPYSLPPHSPSPVFANCTLLIPGISLKGLFSILVALNLTPWVCCLPSFFPPSFFYSIYFFLFCITLQFWEFNLVNEPCQWGNPGSFLDQLSPLIFSSNFLDSSSRK